MDGVPDVPGTIRPMNDADVILTGDPATKSSAASISNDPGTSGRVAICNQVVRRQIVVDHGAKCGDG
jgi:hypothetical protein